MSQNEDLVLTPAESTGAAESPPPRGSSEPTTYPGTERGERVGVLARRRDGARTSQGRAVQELQGQEEGNAPGGRGEGGPGGGVSSPVPPAAPALHTVRFSLRCLRRFSASDWFVFVLFCFQCEDLRFERGFLSSTERRGAKRRLRPLPSPRVEAPKRGGGGRGGKMGGKGGLGGGEKGGDVHPKASPLQHRSQREHRVLGTAASSPRVRGAPGGGFALRF